MTQNYYEILGVDRNATQDEIKLAWRTLAKETHPDRFPNNPDKKKRFIQIKQAYEVLSDYDKRRFYDYELAAKRALVCPSCGKAKMPTHSICLWCALGKAAQPREGEASEPPPPEQEERRGNEEDGPQRWPFGINPDDILEQVMSEGAFRAARGLHPDIRFGVKIGPNLKVDIEGETVELLRDVHRNLSAAQRLAKRIRGWFVG